MLQDVAAALVNVTLFVTLALFPPKLATELPPTYTFPSIEAPPLTYSAPTPPAAPSVASKTFSLALIAADFSTASPPATRTAPSTASAAPTVASVVSATRTVPARWTRDGRM